MVITEKLDGENTCLNQYGVFARSHAAPTRNPWANYLWDTWNMIKGNLGELELFGESLYAVHSIEYTRLQSYYYLFAIRDGEKWLSWDEVTFYAGVLEIPTVPVLYRGTVADLPGVAGQTPQDKLQNYILNLVSQPSSLSHATLAPAPREGVVVRPAEAFTNAAFSDCVLKWVRKNHVQTGEHWTRHWRKASLYYGS